MLTIRAEEDLRQRHWEVALSARAPGEVVQIFNELERVKEKEGGMDKFMRELAERRKNG